MSTTAPRCAYDGCGEPAVASCECCEAATPFCRDHGSPGVDRHDRDGYFTAWPDACWKCLPS